MYSDLRKHAQATIVQLFPQAPFSPQVPAEETDPAFPQEQPRVHHRTCGLCCPVDTLVGCGVWPLQETVHYVKYS